MAVKTTLSKDQVLRLLQTDAEAIKSYGVYKLGLFGSVVRGEETDESDIDILVEFRDGQKTFDHFMELSFYLDELLEKKTQLVTRQAIADWLYLDIKKEIEYVEY